MFGRLRVLSIPSFRQAVDQERDKKYTAYQIQIVYNGTIKSMEKRYSEFYELHKKIQKIMTVKADFPSRMALSKDHKFLESRRIGLENYMQAIIHEGDEELPAEVYDFFEVGPVALAKNSEDVDSIDGEIEPQKPVSKHQPVILFDKHLYLELSEEEIKEEKQLLDVVLQGCLQGFYEEDDQ